MAVEIQPFYGFPCKFRFKDIIAFRIIWFKKKSKFYMPKLKYKMCLPRRLWKNKKDEFCRFNEEHSLIGSGYI